MFNVNLTFIILLVSPVADSLNILQIVPGSSNSHLMFNYKFAELLQNGGHNVTLLTIVMSLGKLADPNPPKGIEEFRFQATLSQAELKQLATSFTDTLFEPVSIARTWHMGHTFRLLLVSPCQQFAKNESLFDELERRNFDLAFGHFFALCPVGIARRLGVEHFMWLAPGTYIMDSASTLMALPNMPSYIPFLYSDYSDRMTFFDRLRNFVMRSTFMASLNMPPSTYDLESESFRNYPDSDFPHLWDLSKRTEALLINGEEFLDFPRPQFSHVIHIGDLEHKKPKKLNEEWQMFMDNSEDGVIMFSFGTIANTSLMPMKTKEAFLKAFSAFPTYSIIWRLEGEMPSGLDEQKHIKLVTWIPQKDLLNHPKMKLFITHGGYNSLLETAQAAVPMIFIPLFADQYGNARRGQRHGLGHELAKTEDNPTEIEMVISEVLTNKKYKKNLDRFSTMLQDKISHSQENAILHFVDKVARKPNWWAVRAPRKLNIIQYFCIDVVLALSFALFTSMALIVKLSQRISRYLKKRSSIA